MVQPVYFRLAWGYRVLAVLIIAGSVGISGVTTFLEFRRGRAPHDIVPLCVIVAMMSAAAAYGMVLWRWSVRVDARGVARRHLVAWDVWTWDDFASGRIVKPRRIPFAFRDPARPLWRRKLGLNCMSSDAAAAIMRLVNTVYQLPPAEPFPPSLKLRELVLPGGYLVMTLDANGVRGKFGGKPFDSSWSEVRGVHLTRGDRVRRDFGRMEIAFADYTLSLPSLGGGKKVEIVNEFLRRYVPAERIDVDVPGERPARHEDVERQLRHTERMAHHFWKMIVFVCILFGGLGGWQVLAATSRATRLVAILVSLIWIVIAGLALWTIYHNTQRGLKQQRRWMVEFDNPPVCDRQGEDAAFGLDPTAFGLLPQGERTAGESEV
jgi:hypothetical protein